LYLSKIFLKGVMADVDQYGNIYLSPPSLTTTICKIDVANFPYDEKRCTIMFGRLVYNYY
jgi:hypothetical protein